MMMMMIIIIIIIKTEQGRNLSVLMTGAAVQVKVST